MWIGFWAAAVALAVSSGVQAAKQTAEGSRQAAGQDAGASESGASRGTPLPQELRVHHEFGQTVTEYVRNGRVYMMTVKPRVGPTQYWSDPDGDGGFQLRTTGSMNHSINLPKWRVGSW